MGVEPDLASITGCAERGWQLSLSLEIFELFVAYVIPKPLFKLPLLPLLLLLVSPLLLLTELSKELLAASREQVNFHLVREDKLLFFLRQVREVDLFDELDQSFDEALVPIAWDHLVDAMLPEAMLDLYFGALV